MMPASHWRVSAPATESATEDRPLAVPTPRCINGVVNRIPNWSPARPFTRHAWPGVGSFSTETPPHAHTRRTVLSASLTSHKTTQDDASPPFIMGALLPVSLSHWPTLAAISLSIVVISLIRRLHAWHRLRQFNGPFWAAFSRWWMIRKVGGGRTHLDLREVNDKYGM